MRFDPPLIRGRLIRRYKRFLADVELDSGARVVAHCANPGSMATCMVEGGTVWLSVSDKPGRKLAHTWELSQVGHAVVCVNTARANELVAEALTQEAIVELTGYRHIRREVAYGHSSRIDFLLEREAGDQACYVEVKSATLSGGPAEAAFPDSVTARGEKHLRELMDVVRRGRRAVLLFVCNRSDADALRPADEIDPLYGHSLRQAAAAGVELLCYQSELSERELRLWRPLPVHLPAFAYQPPAPRKKRAKGPRRGAKKSARPARPMAVAGQHGA